MDIQHNFNLLPYNTFHFDCVAAYFVEIENEEDLQALIQTDTFQNHPHLILGGGSNILLTQERFAGLAIKNNILGKKLLSETDSTVTLQIGAGENWDELVRRSIDQGYCGIENLVSIPGTVGAAPMQNIGAYGMEVKSIIDEVSYITLDEGQLHHITNDQCRFGYRDSIFKQGLKNKVCITQVTITLTKYDPSNYEPCISYGAIKDKLSAGEVSKPHLPVTPRKIATIIADIRASKLPDRHELGTAGSFFKNPIIPLAQFEELQTKFSALKGFPIRHSELDAKSPEERIKLSAGQLIDLAGGKGITKGTVGTYEKHALVLVHHGGGTGEEIVNLAKSIQKKVYDTFGVTIEPEVNYIQ